MTIGTNALLAFIVGCEIAFWVVLLGGLFARYVLKMNRTSAILLYCVPLVDLVLLAATVLDLRGGGTATVAHGLAAAYIGFSVAFGSTIIKSTDRWFAHRLGSGPPPGPPSYGWENVVYELKLWVRCMVAGGIIYVLLIAAIVLVDLREKTEALEVWFKIPIGTSIVWFVFGPLWSTIFWKKAPKKEPEVS
jgi:hypothetical protein